MLQWESGLHFPPLSTRARDVWSHLKWKEIDRMKLKTILNPMAILGVAVLLAGSAFAQTTVELPDSSQQTTLTANVSEQATVAVPASITFDVDDISVSTAAESASVTISNIALASATKQLKISIQADAAAFTPPVAEETTWNASGVTWNAATWTNATGASGTLDHAASSEVATCAADAAGCSTTGLVFTLAPNANVKRAGEHALSITWTFESVGA